MTRTTTNSAPSLHNIFFSAGRPDQRSRSYKQKNCCGVGALKEVFLDRNFGLNFDAALSYKYVFGPRKND